MSDRMFPLQASKAAPPGPRQIPWSVAEVAYGEYSRRYGTGQSLERLAQRGGFGWCEMDMYHPGWRAEVSEIEALKAERDALKAEVERLRRELWEAKAVASGPPGTQTNECLCCGCDREACVCYGDIA